MLRLQSAQLASRVLTVRNGTFVQQVFYQVDARDAEPVDSRKMDQNLRKLHKHRNVSSNVSLNVFGTGGNEISPSFSVNCPDSTYFFNCGEGWVRMATSHVQPLKRQVLFFTRASWENFSGSASFQHYHEMSNCRNVHVQNYCGPQKIDFFIDYIKRFTGKSTWSKIGVFEPGKPGFYKDQNLSMSIIDLKPLKNTANWHLVVAYSCKLADVSDKLLQEKALELGIKPGSVYNMLQQGKSITEEGVLVHPSQVMASENKGPTFLVVDCPTESFIDAVTSNKYLQPEWFCELGQNVNLIVHITPLHILQQEAYCKWMSSFGCDTKHLLLHASICPGEVGYRTAITFSLPFHLMNPNVYHFPIFPDDNIINKKDLNISKYINEDSIILGCMLLKYHLRPSKRVDYSNCLAPVSHHVKQALCDIKKEELLSSRILHHRRILSIGGSLDEQEILPLLGKTAPPIPMASEDDAVITILGSSATRPNPYRNVSGILIQTPSDGNILLDCGEGTLQQLYRCFGHGFAKDILRKLNLIFISHMHPDHHLGVIGILNEVKKLIIDDEFRAVKVIATRNFSLLLNRYSKVCESVQFQSIDAQDVLNMPFQCSGNVTLQTVDADHILNSYGVVLRWKNSWSIVYSGDTAPSKHIVKAGRNATVLIHEGTYSDKLFVEAVRMKHSTYSDAIRMGKAMNADFTVVTHFDTRNPNFSLRNRYWTSLTTPAVDLMSIRISDLQRQQLDSASCRNVFNCISLSDLYK